MTKLIAVCGANCSICPKLKECGGCTFKKGITYYLQGYVCPIYACSTKSGHKNCGECKKIPCKNFDILKSGGASEEEFKACIKSCKMNLEEVNSKKGE